MEQERGAPSDLLAKLYIRMGRASLRVQYERWKEAEAAREKAEQELRAKLERKLHPE